MIDPVGVVAAHRFANSSRYFPRLLLPFREPSLWAIQFLGLKTKAVCPVPFRDNAAGVMRLSLSSFESGTEGDDDSELHSSALKGLRHKAHDFSHGSMVSDE